MLISDNRLLAIAQTRFTDYEDLAAAVNELAAAILERSFNASAITQGQAKPAPEPQAKRMPGRPLGDKQVHPCPKCGEDIVTFLSKSSNRPYPCDVEIGLFKNQRTVLTAPNWFHNCGKGN